MDASGLEYEDHLPLPVEGGTISGTVADFEGVPIVGVRVEAKATGDPTSLDLLPAMTDGSGRFLLEGLIAPAYDLLLGKSTVKARVEAVPIGKMDLAIRLARPQGVVLDVRTSQGDPPPTVIHMALWRQTKDAWAKEHVGRSLEKRMLLAGLRPGTWRLVVHGPPYLPVNVEGFEVRAGHAADVVPVHLSVRGGTIEGTFVDGPGRVRSGWAAWGRADAPETLPHDFRSLAIAEDGTFAISGLPAGRYDVAAWSDGGATAAVVVDVPANGAVQRITLRPAR